MEIQRLDAANFSAYVDILSITYEHYPDATALVDIVLHIMRGIPEFVRNQYVKLYPDRADEVNAIYRNATAALEDIMEDLCNLSNVSDRELIKTEFERYFNEAVCFYVDHLSGMQVVKRSRYEDDDD
jgi:hypothetical protein